METSKEPAELFSSLQSNKDLKLYFTAKISFVILDFVFFTLLVLIYTFFYNSEKLKLFFPTIYYLRGFELNTIVSFWRINIALIGSVLGQDVVFK